MIALTLPGCQTEKEEIQETTEDAVNEKTFRIEEISALPAFQWQKELSFPDRQGNIDDTLAMNSIVGFDGYSGQGTLFVDAQDVDSFDLFINAHRVEGLQAGKICRIDHADFSVNGKNHLQVSDIKGEGKVRVYIPYPELIQGDPEEEGFRKETFELISDIIDSDISHGFSSAQLAVIRHGRLIYQNSWGSLNSYAQDGTRLTDLTPVSNDTLYDLASVTKMFSANYALQKLISEGKLSLQDRICDHLGERFYEDTMDFSYDFGTKADLETQKRWKASLTIEDLLKHEGGFPPDPRYFNVFLDAESQEYDPDAYNLLYSGNSHDEETKLSTIEGICKTPLQYEPRTRSLYSDVDYMILGIIVEMVSGQDLDSYLKDSFFRPLKLEHITYNPLENGFHKEDCAATELNGNTRDGAIYFPGVREYTLQGEVHDEKAWYSMNGISGHAGLFANATDLAKLAYVMFTGGYGPYRFFDSNVIDVFKSPAGIGSANNALGWAREGDDQRSWYYGSSSSSDTIGHQGWTGTLVMIDFERDIVMVYLTNERNTALTDKEANANDFNGLYYTASTLGFVPELFSIGLDQDQDVSGQLLSLLSSMCEGARKLIPDDADEDHPARLNYSSKLAVYEKWKERCGE